MDISLLVSPDTLSAIEQAQTSGLKADETWAIDDHLLLKIGGQAGVFFGKDSQGNRHTKVQKPFLVAGPFPGDVEPVGLYGMINRSYGGSKPLLDALRDEHGYDIILVKFIRSSREISLLITRLEEFSLEMQFCISKTIKALEDSGSSAELVVAGVSMGGLVARHALTAMEKVDLPHRTAIYLSWDSPHRGAMLAPPVWGTCQMAYLGLVLKPELFLALSAGYTAQMLFHRFLSTTADWNSTLSERHETFLKDLWDIGGHPQLVRARYAIANGRPDAKPLCQPGQILLDTKGPINTGLTLRAEQPNQAEPAVARIQAPDVLTLRFEANLPDSWSGAAGGYTGFLKNIAELVNGTVTPGAQACFIPTASALDAIDGDSPSGAVDLSRTNFDEVLCGDNTGHCDPDLPLMQFVYQKLTNPFPVGPTKPVQKPPSFRAGSFRQQNRGNYIHFSNRSSVKATVWLKGNGLNQHWGEMQANGGTTTPYQPTLQNLPYNYEFWTEKSYLGTLPSHARPDDKLLTIHQSDALDLLCLSEYPQGPLPDFTIRPVSPKEGRRWFHFLNELDRPVTLWIKGGGVNSNWGQIAPGTFGPPYEPYKYDLDFSFEFWDATGYVGTLGSQSVRTTERLVRLYNLGTTFVMQGIPYYSG